MGDKGEGGKKSQKMGDVNDGRPVSKLKYYDFVEKSATFLNVALIFLILRTHCVCTIRSSRPTKMFQVTGGQMESGGF